MATITLSIIDTDLAAGTYKVDIAAQGNEIDEGLATAAYFTGFFLTTIINTPAFLAGAGEFGRGLVEAMQEDGDYPMTDQPARMVLTLVDKDLGTGRYNATLESFGGDPEGKSLPTPAQIVGGYMRGLIHDANFRDDVWAFADEFVKNNLAAQIANNDQAPTPDDAEAA